MRMPAPLQQQLQSLVVQFLYQKKFVGCAGLDITDEMRYTIAGQACLLLLNRQSAVYPELDTILVYPDEFVVTRNEVGPGGVVTPSANGLLGESWGDGRVILAWNHVQRGAADWTDGHNVVLHEFAHQLDSESGAANGAPYLPNVSSYRSWATVLSRDFDNLRHDAIYHQKSVMDHYGATNPAEFFAVATETFLKNRIRWPSITRNCMRSSSAITRSIRATGCRRRPMMRHTSRCLPTMHRAGKTAQAGPNSATRKSIKARILAGRLLRER